MDLGPDSFTPLAPVITFAEVPLGTTNPVFTFNDLPQLGDVTVSFGGHFVGQTASGGFPVTLTGTPTAPLTLDPAAPNTFTVNNGVSDSNPVLSGSPVFNGPICARFSVPVAGVGLKGGFFDNLNSTSIEAYASDGTVLGRVTNSVTGFEFYGLADSSGRNVIQGICFFITGVEGAGFEIDNVTFGTAQDIILPLGPVPATSAVALGIMGVLLAGLGVRSVLRRSSTDPV